MLTFVWPTLGRLPFLRSGMIDDKRLPRYYSKIPLKTLSNPSLKSPDHIVSLTYAYRPPRENSIDDFFPFDIVIVTMLQWIQLIYDK